MKLQLASPSHYALDLDLPWELPLADWPQELFVPVARGIHRNVVGFLARGDQVYALKELAQSVAEKEYRLLRELEEMGLPVVEPIGIISERDQVLSVQPAPVPENKAALSDRGVLITRYLEGALPYRIIIERGTSETQLYQMLDALAELLVRLHLSGFYWGDCSLSNALFRRDAGLLAAYLVDAETGELHNSVSATRRDYDLDTAHTNLAGDLMDLEALLGELPGGLDPVDLAAHLVDRYRSLWQELTTDQVFASDEQYLIDQRIQRLNALGFDVEEMQLESVAGGSRIRMQVKVVEPWHHKRILHNLTGLRVEENQARRLLNDINRYRARWAEEGGADIPEAVTAYRWLHEVFYPVIREVPVTLRRQLDDAEVYHELLEHRWYLSEARQQDVGMRNTLASYIEDVLKKRPAAPISAASVTGGNSEYL